MSLNQKDFARIGGLQKQIRIIKEMVLFPLIYGEVYAKFNLRPPRGLLFYGPPGTGKTLVASALAAECSNAERKVHFISRKGSDCLSKWVGESEKKLQDIFHVAKQNKPCIIFFDEVDGLAPVRTPKQDFVHSSVVSVLLALMDGLDNSSEIIVIGATNRLDAIDPALRRPGRFDRELYFPLPCYSARKEILSIYVKSWKQKPAQKFIAYLAANTVGYCGSDLQALCTEAVMCCIRRIYPQIYTTKTKLGMSDRVLKVERQDFLKAQKNIVPAAHRITISPIKCLPTKIQPLLHNNLTMIMTRLQQLCPVGMLTTDVISGQSSLKSSNCPRLLLCGNDDCHTKYLGPAVLHTFEHLPCHIIDVTTLFEDTCRAVEEAVIQIVKGARRTLPSLLYVPDIFSWWNIVSDTVRVVFTSLLRGLDRSVNILILTTANAPYNELPSEIASLYDEHQGEVFEIIPATDNERLEFFSQLFNKSRLSNSGDDISPASSSDYVYAVGVKRGKPEGLKRKAKTAESIKKSRMEGKRRVKLSSVQSMHSVTSTHSASPIFKPNIAVKREYFGFGEASSSKKRKLSEEDGMRRPSSSSKCTEAEIDYLLTNLVNISRNWMFSQIESLYALLEYTIKNKKVDTFNVLKNCIERFQEIENNKSEIKQENDSNY